MRRCPVCAHTGGELLFTQEFSGHFTHRIISCANCCFVYVNNDTHQSFYDDYYKNQSKYEGTRQDELHDAITYKTVDLVLRKFAVDKTARILDVGCSTGKLLHFIKEKGFTDVHGIEPAPQCRRIAKKQYGIPVITTTLANFSPTKKYDFIILSQLLEHLIDVRSSILKIYSLLNEGGMVFVGVPDSERFHIRFDEPFGEFSTEHINFFTLKSLERLFGKFRNVYSKTDNKTLISLWEKGCCEKKEMSQYIASSEAKMDQIKKMIAQLPSRIVVWGAGSLTQRLLSKTGIKKKIIKLVDGSPNLVGKKMGGIDIISPLSLSQYPEPILILSFRFRKEIMGVIKKMKLPNTIITLK